jgi:hypothetical protein
MAQKYGAQQQMTVTLTLTRLQQLLMASSTLAQLTITCMHFVPLTGQNFGLLIHPIRFLLHQPFTTNLFMLGQNQEISTQLARLQENKPGIILQVDVYILLLQLLTARFMWLLTLTNPFMHLMLPQAICFGVTRLAAQCFLHQQFLVEYCL